MLTQNDINRLHSYFSRFKIYIKKYNPSQYNLIELDLDDLSRKIDTVNRVLKSSLPKKQLKFGTAHIQDDGEVIYK